MRLRLDRIFVHVCGAYSTSLLCTMRRATAIHLYACTGNFLQLELSALRSDSSYPVAYPHDIRAYTTFTRRMGSQKSTPRLATRRSHRSSSETPSRRQPVALHAMTRMRRAANTNIAARTTGASYTRAHPSLVQLPVLSVISTELVST